MKDVGRILLIGDDGVGKSSLISTFVARHFPSTVPSIVADTTIPAESTADDVAITIIDSSSRPSEREGLRKKIVTADSFLVLYDVTRPETLENVSRLWLPLIEEICGSVKKPAFVLGTKLDLLDDDEDLDKLKAITDQFSFVILASKCSAVKLDVDRAIYLGASVIAHPLFPIFDMKTKEFTPAARSALLRVFRIIDRDGDNLWSDDELFEVQSKCFLNPIIAREIPIIKRQIHNSTSAGVVRNKLTFEGFLSLLTTNVYNTLGIAPWTILRNYGYDDDLLLQIPKEVSTAPALAPHQICELSDGARFFLLSLARNAYTENAKPIRLDSEDNSEMEDCLTWEAMRWIWSVLTVDEPTPWSFPPQCKMVWPENDDKIHPIAQSVLLTSLQHSGGSVSFDAWIAHWQALAMADPARTQTLLYKLGYADRSDLGLLGSYGTIKTAREDYRTLRAPRGWLSYFFTSHPAKSPFRPRNAARICILGDNGVGKSSLVWYASDLSPPGSTDACLVEKGVSSEKAYESIVVGGSLVRTADSSDSDSITGTGTAAGEAGFLTDPLCLVFVAVPMDHVYKYLKLSIQACDCVLLVFQCGNEDSLHAAWKLEQLLPDHIPRFYVAHKADILHGQSQLDLIERHEQVFEMASLYVKEHDLPAVHCTSTVNGVGVSELVRSVREVLQCPEIAQPRHYKERKPSFFTSSSFWYLSAAVAAVSLSVAWLRYQKDARAWVEAALRGTTRLAVSPDK